jgi:hypothetical protein
MLAGMKSGVHREIRHKAFHQKGKGEVDLPRVWRDNLCPQVPMPLLPTQVALEMPEESNNAVDEK